MQKKSIIALLLAAMLLPTLAACGETDVPAAEDTSAADTTVQETEKETTAEEYRNSISDEVENEDFGGR